MTINGWRWIAVVLFWLTPILLVLLLILFPSLFDSPGYSIFCNALWLAAFLLWWELDAACRGFAITRRMRYFVVFLWPIALPLYVVRSRGWLRAVGFLACVVAAAAVAMLCGFGVVALLEVIYAD